MTDTIIAERLNRLPEITLKAGNSKENDRAMCVMEAVSYVAGEPWSDHPSCACPVITAFMVSWNDSLPNDDDRKRLLKPLIPHLIGTRGSKALESRRASMAADWFIRVQAPAWLRLAGLTTQADALASFPEITDFAKTPSLMPVLEGIRKDADAAEVAAWNAAGAAARAAARVAAEVAAWDAARVAAWDAARAAAWAAAKVAAWDAAWDAAWAAAKVAAWAAAWAALTETTATLQASAAELVIRMCALTEEGSTDER